MTIRDIGSLRALVVGMVAAGGALAASGAGALAADPSGVWMVADQSAKIRIEPCADGYWGAIDWERKAGVDANNPDPAKRGRPLLGTPILIAMKPAEPNEWQGKVYNPKDGSYYKANISLSGSDVLKLEGCMWVFCGGENWTRVSEQARATTGAGGRITAQVGAQAGTQASAHSICPQQSSGAAPAPRRD
jgi:uncharacterized protein (DUF2147 family)